MSATTGGALKAHLEAASLGLAVYRDRAPDDASLPFIIVQEGISRVPELDGDTGDDQAAHGLRELVQASLFQEWRKPDGTPGEDYTLPGKVHKAIHGKRLATAPTMVYGMKVQQSVRLPQIDGPGETRTIGTFSVADGANVVQDVFTIEVRRNV